MCVYMFISDEVHAVENCLWCMDIFTMHSKAGKLSGYILFFTMTSTWHEHIHKCSSASCDPLVAIHFHRLTRLLHPSITLTIDVLSLYVLMFKEK